MSIYRRFVPLAMRAALKLPIIKEASIRTVGPERVAGLMDVWLIALEPRLAHAARIFPDRAVVERLCEESADLCSIFESEALEKEHNAEVEEKQRLDPRNWSPLRQYYESFKVTKELLAQTQEEIPESLVRDVLAQQYGVGPEEVTERQIIFEVSGLLREYPSIRVVPAIPQLGVDAENANDPRGRLKAEREQLRDSYLNGFAEKVYILDVCWAVKQRYREWTRWIGGYLKDELKPARAFRAILASGKRPEEYRPEPRPKGWK
jgi:hypothetical protein